MAILLGSLVLRGVVTPKGVAVVGSRLGSGLAMPAGRNPNHADYPNPDRLLPATRTPPAGPRGERLWRSEVGV